MAIGGLLWAGLRGVLGYVLGSPHGRGPEGLILCILFDPVGLLISFLLPRGRTCPFCGASIVKKAVRCIHCQKHLPPTAASRRA